MVGTCSWTDPTLTKQTAWYPKRSMSAEDRLRYYAGQFSLVEADATYYRPPTRELARSWAERVPDGFCFDIKAYGMLTGHPVDPAALWPDIRQQLTPDVAGERRVYAHHLPPDALEEVWARFLDALRPLDEGGRLGAVLFQYPPWFVPRRSNRDELARLAERLGSTLGCVELRSPKWWEEADRQRTLDLLTRSRPGHRGGRRPARFRAPHRAGRHPGRPGRRPVPRAGRQHLERPQCERRRTVPLPL